MKSLKLLDPNICNSLPRVSSDRLFISQDKVDQDGLFSSKIFGTSRSELYSNVASITLNDQFLHPILYDTFKKIYRLNIADILRGKPYIIKEGLIEIQLEKTKDSLFGLRPLFLNLLTIVPKDTKTSDEFWGMVSRFKDDILIKCTIVIPLGYRNYISMMEYDLINGLYVDLIRSVNNMSKTEPSNNDERYATLYNKTFLSLNNLYENLKIKLSKKYGIIRGNVLGKRVDFSARCVITSDNTLKPDTIGVPVSILVKIFEPWLIRSLLNEYNYKMDDILRIIQVINKGGKPGKDYETVKEALNNICSKRYVLAKRDPALHRLSWQAFRPILVEDKTVHVFPLQVSGFNADFDGDTMSLFTPVSEEAIEEVKLMTNPYSAANPRYTKYSFDKDFIYASCLLLDKKGLYSKAKEIKIENKTVTITKGIETVFDCLDESDRTLENLDIVMKGKDMNDISTNLSHTLDVENYKDFIDKIHKTLLEVMTIHPNSITMDDLSDSDKIKDLLTIYKNEKDLVAKNKLRDNIRDELVKITKDSDTLNHIVSCKAGWGENLVQLLGVKGTVQSPDGELISIDNNFSNGLTKKEYFLSSQGARTGVTARTNYTRMTGYLARKLVYATTSVTLDTHTKDCGTHKYIELISNPDIAKRLINRYVYKDNELELITLKNYKEFSEGLLKLRSPVFCKDPDGICETCYGLDYKFYNSDQVGTIAAQSISERITQTILKAFHTGGTVNVNIPNMLESIAFYTSKPKKHWEEIFDYKDNIIFAKKDIELTLSKEFYNLNAIEISPEINLDMLMGEIKIDDKSESIVYNSNLLLYVDDIEKTKLEFIMRYKKGDKIFRSLAESSNSEKKAKILIASIEGGFKFKDITHAITTLYTNLKPFGDISLVHIEVLLSQILRCKDDPSKPFRLCKSDEYEISSVKNIPFLESWTRGLEFENFSKGVINGLLHSERITKSKLDDLLISSE